MMNVQNRLVFQTSTMVIYKNKLQLSDAFQLETLVSY